MKTHTLLHSIVVAALALLAACSSTGHEHAEHHAHPQVHYLEIVCGDVAVQCAALERLHGLTFGPPVADLGQARVANAPDGTLIGVRAPLAQHETPIVRTYLAVDDIQRATVDAQNAGAILAYGPTRQGDTGMWAIYFLGDVQIGLWQP
jgi:hypothetical protein